MENYEFDRPVLSLEEKAILEQFREDHSRDASGRFIIPLLIKNNTPPLGDSRSQAVRRFKSFQRSLRAKSQFDQFAVAMREYFYMGHAEVVPEKELNKAYTDVFLPSNARGVEGI